MNVYVISECEHCGRFTAADRSFIVHGSENLRKAEELKALGLSLDEIAQQFCGHCGGHVPMTETECGCGNLQRQ